MCYVLTCLPVAQANVNLKYEVNVMLSQFEVITIQHLLKQCPYSLEYVSPNSNMSCSSLVTCGSRHHLTSDCCYKL